jgi:hypothetical protein
MYLTYSEYQDMGGTLDETTFNNMEFEARSYVDYVTFNRLQNEEELPQAVKQCMYYLITLVTDKLNALTGTDISGTSSGGAVISSQSNDGVSVSYNVMAAKDILDSNTKEINNTINRYLQGVVNSLGQKVLYRGLYPGE